MGADDGFRGGPRRAVLYSAWVQIFILVLIIDQKVRFMCSSRELFLLLATQTSRHCYTKHPYLSGLT